MNKTGSVLYTTSNSTQWMIEEYKVIDMERKYTHRLYIPIHKDFPYNSRRGWELRIFVDKDMVHTIEIYICQRYLHRALNTDNILIASTRTTSLYYYHNLNRFISYTLSILRIVPPRQQSFPRLLTTKISSIGYLYSEIS